MKTLSAVQSDRQSPEGNSDTD